MSREDNAAGTVILAFVLGAITGAAVALLMAPASGEEVRRILSDKAREGADRARGMADQGRELWNRQRDTIATAFERGREAYEEARGTRPAGETAGGPGVSGTPTGEGL
jgi:gas vesicle protein